MLSQYGLIVHGHPRTVEEAGMIAGRVERNENCSPRGKGDDGRPETSFVTRRCAVLAGTKPEKEANDEILMTKAGLQQAA